MYVLYICIFKHTYINVSANVSIYDKYHSKDFITKQQQVSWWTYRTIETSVLTTKRYWIVALSQVDTNFRIPDPLR